MHLQRDVIVITGNVSSGKSTVCRMLQQAGKKVVSADVLVHKLLGQPKFQSEIQLRFDGPRVRDENFVAQVRKQVFSNERFREWYIPWMHKHVAHEIQRCLKQNKKRAKQKLFLDIPLYFESARSWLRPEHVWLVWTPRDLRRRRWQARKKAPMKEMELIEQWQIPDEEKFQKVDIILVNSLSMKELEQQVCLTLGMLK